MLRPSFKFTNSYQEACERVAKMEEEIKESVLKAVPNFEQLVNTTTGEVGGDAGGLGTIREDEEDDERGYTGEVDDDEYGGGEYDDEDPRPSADLDELDEGLERKPRVDSMNADSNGSEVDEAPDVVNLVQPKKQQEVSKEDEEFIKAFDALVSENIAVFKIMIFFYKSK